jgi:CRISPR-associated endonuclease/helicase Cas3
MIAAVLAHSSADGGDGHALESHLKAVEDLAREFAAPYGGDWAALAGRWHDLGKYRPGFQAYIRSANRKDAENAHVEHRVSGREKTHSIAGALWAIREFERTHGARGKLAARVFAYLIASHHAGLYDWDGGLDARLNLLDSADELSEALAAKPSAHILSADGFDPDLRGIPGGANGFSLWIRMLFSALVDADFLDTEAYFDDGRKEKRAGFPALSALLPAFDYFMQAKSREASPSTVNTLRAEVLDQCRKKAKLPPGFFTLTVPTGGGKTLSSLAFALEHAKAHKKHRIIYAIPFTSIIEQTADVFRSVFSALGTDVLIEHHSQADANETDETARSRLACENWDAPLIVTTNVQLFESLFAAKTSRVRKLHNLVDSVIILDEAQQLPPEFLQPILSALKLLVAHYGVTVVLCTATQPALTTTSYFDASQNLTGIDSATEIIDDPDALYAQLKRVEVTLPADWNVPMSWQDVADQLIAEDCVLVIVNTRGSALDLHALMPAGTLHLSARMCGAHRSDVIKDIKSRLQAKRKGHDHAPLRVVSTQLVEAGVDIDFPVVWRAVAGLDAIAQAAGRCNREGAMSERGRVVVFVPPVAVPAGMLRKGAQACRSVLASHPNDPMQRPLFATYFRQFYASVDCDAKCIGKLLTINDRAQLNVQFRSAAEAFKLIDDADDAAVIVFHARAYEKIKQLLAILASEGPKRWLMRKLQRYSINIKNKEAQALLGRGLILVSPGLYAQDADNLYDQTLGWRTESNIFNPSATFL